MQALRHDLDTTSMLAKCQRLQWSVHDIDWQAPGKDRVGRDQARDLRAFMTDLYWIESAAAIVFRAMSEATPEQPLSDIYASFSIDEQRHADAELELMRRWGIVGAREVPAPNLNARNLLTTIDRVAHRLQPAVFAAIIPFTELVLDGALVKHLEVAVLDPVCREVFRRINADEARHLAIDFHVLERTGAARGGGVGLRDTLTMGLDPLVFYALTMGYLPLLARMRPGIERIGLSEEQVFACVQRYIALGDESEGAARHPVYRMFRRFSRRMVAGKTEIGDTLLRISDLVEAARVRLS
jgi:hypothetical protein